MKKLILIIVSCFVCFCVYSQTFSKTYNLTSNHEILDNSLSILRDIEFHNGNIYLHVEHLCDPDTTDNRRAYCTGIYKLDHNGEELRSIVFDSLFAFGFNKMALTEEKLYVVGIKHGDESGLSNVLYTLNLELIIEHKFEFDSGNEEGIENNGIIKTNNNFYIYGKNANGSGTTLSYIQKINSNFELVDEFRFRKGLSFNGCLDLQPTADDNLIYINDWSDGVGAQPSGEQIMVIDTDGNPLDSLNINQFTDLSRVLLSSSSGDVYCFSERNPNGQILQSHGRVNKYDKELDSLLWSTELPFNNFTNARRYKATNMIEAQNGDILVCGTVFDEGPDGPIANGYDHTWNGFITRLDTDGNILWLRLYKTDNNYPLVPKSEYGRFLNSTIWNIHELEDGRIVTGGTSYHTGWQNDIIRPAGETEFYAWLMTVNADGCLDGVECDEVIILDGEYKPKDGYLPIITSDQTWMSQKGGQAAPPESFQFAYSEDSLIVDTNIYYERIQSNNEDGADAFIQGYYRELEGKVYQKFEGNFNEEVIFDITLMEGDTFFLYTPFVNLVVERVDTVTFADNIPRKRIDLKCTNYEEDPIIWIEGIGELSSGAYCTIDGIDINIRCVFDNDGQRIYSIIDQDKNCWITTSIIDINSEQFSLFPNPATDVIHIESEHKIHKVEIYTSNGLLLKAESNSNSIDLTDVAKGLYYLKMYSNEGVGVQTFIKY